MNNKQVDNHKLRDKIPPSMVAWNFVKRLGPVSLNQWYVSKSKRTGD